VEDSQRAGSIRTIVLLLLGYVSLAELAAEAIRCQRVDVVLGQVIAERGVEGDVASQREGLNDHRKRCRGELEDVV
jgi:hypothetical protein